MGVRLTVTDTDLLGAGKDWDLLSCSASTEEDLAADRASGDGVSSVSWTIGVILTFLLV